MKDERDSGARWSGHESAAAMTGSGYALCVLCIVSILNYADRQVLSMLVDPIKRDLGISDTGIGILSGVGFAAVHATAAIPLALWADRGVRRNIVAFCLAFWSLMTAICGLAANFLQLAAARAGVAIGEAGAAPAIQSLLADFFPPSRRAGALGALTAAQSTGVAVGMLVGGIGVEYLGWRGVFIAIGLPGVLLALVVLATVREPHRSQARKVADMEDASPTLRSNIAALWRIRTFRALFGTAAASGFAGYALLGWTPSYFIRVHGIAPGELGIYLSVATVTSLVIGNLGAGLLADRLSMRSARWYLLIPVAGCAIAWPFAIGFAFANSFAAAIAFFFLMELFFTLHLAPIYATVTLIAPSRMRGTAVMVIGAAMALLGNSLGPLVAGFANDVLAPYFGSGAIRYSLAMVATFGMGALGLIAWVGARHIEQDLIESRPHSGEPRGSQQ